MMRWILIIPTALMGLLVLTPTVSATLGLLRPGVGPEAKEGAPDQVESHSAGLDARPPSGGTEVSSPSMTGGVAAFWPQTGGIGVFPSGGVGPGSPVEPGKCRKGTHKVRRKGKVVCVKNKKGNKAGKASQAGRASR